MGANEIHPEDPFAGAFRSEAHGLQVDVEFDFEKELVAVKAKGELNGKSTPHLARRFSEAARDRGWQRILCDCRATRFTESVIGIYEAPYLLQREKVPRGLRIAVVYEKDEQKHRFWETVVRNRGFMARVFQKPTDAFRWLLEAEG